ncbi:MAG: L-histidine N(alpha)-methyltransferase, partial [Bryobacteraceae bacterium]|nr:L-histidine N(alpha)-methyltransferase [Bryobacteraceae bacterium]
LLDRMNSELGADFDRGRFVHHASYNVVQGCMESWIIITQRQQVRFRSLERTFSLDAWEGIHLECSYKYSLGDIEDLIEDAGYRLTQSFLDRRRWFADMLLRAPQ